MRNATAWTPESRGISGAGRCARFGVQRLRDAYGIRITVDERRTTTRIDIGGVERVQGMQREVVHWRSGGSIELAHDARAT
jgi:hypothetical protein